jgi:hypothetical protein
MSMASQQYASLANASYKDQFQRSDPYPIGGVSYKVLEHHNNPRTGYQGTVYQRVDTGEIIVAHRGTETEEGLGQLLKDGLVDGVMVASRLNAQAADAVALTQRALDYAERESRKPGGHAPEVTVTGHSLGGTLAQITAHHFGLRGETFNAYGAASLGYSIDKSGGSVINHVMAGDTVSAASPHFGQVRVYASAGEIAALHNCGYANDGNRLDPRAPGLALGILAGSHGMHHFLNEDGKGRPDRSILSDPAARQLAEVFDPMIDKFRSDIALGRSIATVAARGPLGNARDALEELRGPVSAGEPAARAERVVAAEAAATQRLADYHEQRQQFFRERLPPIDPDARPPEQLRRPETKDAPESIIRYQTPDYLQSASPAQKEQRTDRLDHERATLPSDARLQRGDQAQAFPIDHPRYPLYAALEERLPGMAKEKIAEVTHQAVVGGVTDPGQIRAVVVREDQVWVAGRIPGYRANVSLSEPPPSLDASLRGIESADRLQMQQTAPFQEQQRSASQGHALS